MPDAFLDATEWATGGDIPTTGPAANLFPEDLDRFGGLTADEFLRRYWDPDAGDEGDWRAAPNEGAVGPITPNTLEVGDLIDRFGPRGGQFASPFETPYPSVPYRRATSEGVSRLPCPATTARYGA